MITSTVLYNILYSTFDVLKHEASLHGLPMLVLAPVAHDSKNREKNL